MHLISKMPQDQTLQKATKKTKQKSLNSIILAHTVFHCCIPKC